MAKRYSKQEIKTLEGKLMLDIREFLGIQHRRPTDVEVMDWLEIYGYNPNGFHDNWAKRLIKRALKGLDVHKNVQKSSFELYLAVESNVNNNVLDDFSLDEILGINNYEEVI